MPAIKLMKGSHLSVTFLETFNKIADTHTSCEVCQDKLHGQRRSTSYLYHYNFSFNGYLLVC